MRDLFFKDISLKILAFLLSLSIWFFATIDRSYVLTRRFLLSFPELPPGKVVSYQSTDFVDVLLEGKGRDFLALGGKGLTYRISLKEIKTGRERIKFSPEDLGLSERVRVLGFKPEAVEVEIDDLVAKRVPVKVPRQGVMGEGFFLTECEVLDTVLLSGPKGEMGFINFLYTESLSLKGIKQSQEKELKVLSPGGRGFFIRPERVRVRLKVEPETIVTIEGIPVKTDRPVKILPREAKITISGPPSFLREIKRGEIKVFIPMRGLKPGRYSLPAQILLPPGILFKKCEPERFEVEIRG